MCAFVHAFIFYYAAQHEKRTKILTNTPQFNFAPHDLINVFYSQVETNCK